MSEMGGMLNFIFEKKAFFFANCQVRRTFAFSRIPIIIKKGR